MSQKPFFCHPKIFGQLFLMGRMPDCPFFSLKNWKNFKVSEYGHVIYHYFFEVFFQADYEYGIF